MIVKIVPSTEQIIFDLRAVLGCFETLGHDPELAYEIASMHLNQLIDYLEAVNGANNVHTAFNLEGAEDPLVLKGFLDKNNRVKKANLKAAEVLPLRGV